MGIVSTSDNENFQELDNEQLYNILNILNATKLYIFNGQNGKFYVIYILPQ